MADANQPTPAPAPSPDPGASAPASQRPATPPDAILVHITRNGAHKKTFKRQHAQLQDEALAAMARKKAHPPAHRITMVGDWRFIREHSADVKNNLCFDDGHDLSKRPRYTWYQVSPDMLHGYLTPEAKADLALRADPASSPIPLPPVSVVAAS